MTLGVSLDGSGLLRKTKDERKSYGEKPKAVFSWDEEKRKGSFSHFQS